MCVLESFNGGKYHLNTDGFLFQNTEVSVFEVNIRFVGGLLSAYYLSGKEVSVSSVPYPHQNND